MSFLFSSFERLVAYRYLRSPRQEGFISVIAGFSFLGIALGVATLIIVMSVMNGFRQELLTRIIGMRGHLVVHGIHAPLTNFDALTEEARHVSGVVGVYPMVERQAIITFRSQARGVAVHGIKLEDLQKRALIVDNIKQGSLKDFNDPDSIIIGRRMADQLHINVGDHLTMISPTGNVTAFGTIPRQKSFKVIAVFEVGMHEFDKSVIFMTLPSAQQFFKLPDQVTHLEIFVDNIEKTAERGFLIQSLVGEKAKVLDWEHSDSSIFHAVQVERNVMFLILTLIIVIAAFNIISSLIMLVKDKTRDIAIMRTMGAARSSILKIFFLTGASIGTIGTLSGVLLGLSFALNIESIRQFLQKLSGTELFSAEIYFLSQLPAKVDWSEVITVIVMSLALSFLATVYPSWRASRLDPIEALRS
jgi:lipoprotein-releasing system permease protein